MLCCLLQVSSDGNEFEYIRRRVIRDLPHHSRGRHAIFDDVTGSDAAAAGSALADGQRGEEAKFSFVRRDNGLRWFPARVDSVDGYEAVEWRWCDGVLGTSFGRAEDAVPESGTT